MAQTFEKITVESEGVTLSRLIWRRFKAPMPGLLERILEANRGLADLGTHLPVGTVVMVPIDAPRETATRNTAKRLW